MIIFTSQASTPAMAYSAGVLPYTIQSGEVFFLLGKDTRDGLLSDYGGKCEPEDRGIPLKTAIREFNEESLGMFGSVESMTEMMSRTKYFTMYSRTLTGNSYTMYVVRVPYHHLQPKMFDTFHSFLKASSAVKHFYLEKCQICWVSQQRLLRSVSSSHDPLKLRPVFKQTLLKNIRAIQNIGKTLQVKSHVHETSKQCIKV